MQSSVCYFESLWNLNDCAIGLIPWLYSLILSYVYISLLWMIFFLFLFCIIYSRICNVHYTACIRDITQSQLKVKMTDWRRMPGYLIVCARLRRLRSACMSKKSGWSLPFLIYSLILWNLKWRVGSLAGLCGSECWFGWHTLSSPFMRRLSSGA